MPNMMRFKEGSVIFFDGEVRGNDAYLVKEGSLVRTKISSITTLPERSRVAVGEFFGIKAALGNFPRDETIQALTDTIVYRFSPAEFIDVASKNLKILFKMLGAFSNELRKIHLSLEKKLGTTQKSNERKLLDIAQYYTKHKKYTFALYASKRFQEIYPQSPELPEVAEKIVELEQLIVK